MKKARTLSAFDVPADSDCSIPRIVLTGSGYVKVEHHRGVLTLTPACVRLFSGIGVIKIEGRDLLASRMDDDEILLDGTVKCVSFE